MSAGRHWRGGLVVGCAALLWLLLLTRGAYLSLCVPESRAAAIQQQTKEVTVPGARGPILDRNGRRLSCTLENPSLALHLDATRDRGKLLQDLLDWGACSEDRARDICRLDRGFVWVSRDWVSADVIQRSMAAGSGVRLVPEMKRFYPAGSVAPELLGIVGRDGHGLSGVEWQYDQLLSGQPGRM